MDDCHLYSFPWDRQCFRDNHVILKRVKYRRIAPEHRSLTPSIDEREVHLFKTIQVYWPFPSEYDDTVVPNDERIGCQMPHNDSIEK